MAGFFSLGTPGSSGSQNPLNSNNSSTNNNGYFEIWQQYVQVHHNHTASKLHLHDQDHDHHHQHLLDDQTALSYSSKGGSMSMSMSINCLDCGNQAKKGCLHLRCRTCCKTRGFDCPIHVNSTWIPASRRRERQHGQLALHQPPGGGGGRGGSDQKHQLGVMRDKRANTTNNIDTSGLEVGKLPAEVNSPAEFRCVRVSGIDNQNEQFAYQTAVNIGGHLFKGILYDQGPAESRYGGGGGESSSRTGGGHGCGTQHQQKNTPIATTTTNHLGGGGGGGASSVTASLVDPSTIYPTQYFNGFIDGTQFFPPPRS